MKENGLNTIIAITETTIMAQTNPTFPHPVLLDDGDEIAIPTEVAQGIMMLFKKLLDEKNKLKMKSMTVLELLNMYEEAVKDGILVPSKLKTAKQG